jgi:iron complex outermembrane recepter protein
MKLFSATTVLLIVVTLLHIDSAQSAGVPLTNTPTDVSSTNAPIVLPEITVVGRAVTNSLTSPSIAAAQGLKKEVPGGFTIQGVDAFHQSRGSNFEDLFQNTPGLVTLSENEVEVSKVFIRGSGVFSEDEPPGVQYLIDGLTLNQGDGEIILEDFDAGSIKYAEVYRGANALQYGGLGLGGAVNFVPFTGYDVGPLNASVEGGSFGFVRGQVSSGGVDGPFDYYISVSGREREGYRQHSEDDTAMLFSDFGYKFSDQLENRFYLVVDQEDRELPGALSKEQMEQNPRQAQGDGTPDGAIAQDWRKEWYYMRLADKLSFKSDDEEANAGIYWWHRQADEPNQFIPDVLLEGTEKFYADDFGALVNSITRGEFLGGENVLTLGVNPTGEVEVDQYYENLNGHTGATTGKDLELSLNAVGFGQVQHYLTQKFSLVTGLQAAYALRHFYDDFNDTADGDQSFLHNYRSLSPKIGAIYDLTEKDQIYANLSRSWQPPSFDEMVDFDTGPDTSQESTFLHPEKAWTAEIGTRGETERFTWELTLYHSWVRDELLDLNNAMDVDIGGVNAAHTYHQGIEAGLETKLLQSIFVKENKGHLADRLTLRQDFTLTDLHFANDPVYGYNRIGGVPTYDYQAQLMYENGRGLYAGPNLSWFIKEYPVDNANLLYAQAPVLLGFRAGCPLGKGFSIFFEAKNLLDQVYASSVDPISSANAFPAPIQVFHPGDPRSFYGGVAYSW